jgi:hypothetical protein
MNNNKQYILLFSLLEASIICANRIKDEKMKQNAKYWFNAFIKQGKQLRVEYSKHAKESDKANGLTNVNGDMLSAQDIYDYFGLLIADSSEIIYDITDYETVINNLKQLKCKLKES